MNNSFATLCPKYAGLLKRKTLKEQAAVKSADKVKAVRASQAAAKAAAKASAGR